MPSDYTVADYIADLRAIRATGAATAEVSYYPPLERLLNSVGQRLKPSVLFSSQVRDSGAGIPDGGFFSQPRTSRRNSAPALLVNPERGVVEIKPADQNLDTLAIGEQTLRYLRHYGLVFITNFRQFRLLQLNSAGEVIVLERYTLADTPADLWTAPITWFAKHKSLLPDFLARVLLYRVPLTQPKDVAWLLASYAREARARVEDHPLGSFDVVKRALQESLGMRFEGEKGEHFFRSTLVQTLFYGIFSAWILWRRTPQGRNPGSQFDWRISAHHLRVPVLRKLFGEVADPGALNSIRLHEILDLAGKVLNRVELEFFRIFREEDAVAYFYEPFLEAFDPQLRKELGVWYTPKEIVQYMVERVDHLLRTELNQPLGLASPAVRILDPCCGTGAYLTAVLNRIYRTLLEAAGDDVALVPSRVRAAALSRIFGFEIMPAPFVIAHLQLASLLESIGSPLSDNHRAGVYLTNALTGWVPERHPQSVIFEEFRREREDSEHIKQQDTILVILGNPPYNGYAGIAKIEEERNLTYAYRAPIDGLPVPQGQGLNDLYIRFFRIAERRIVGDSTVSGNTDGCGIVSFISNYSWLDGLSHTSMRHRYRQTFNDIYIDNLHGDRKISEYAPDGRTSETIFALSGTSVGIKVGTAISTLVRKNRQQHVASVHYRDFQAARASERRDALMTSIESHQPSYAILQLNDALGIPFKPRQFQSSYLEWPRLPEVFPVSFPGIKTSRDSLVVDIDRDRLEERMMLYCDPNVSDARITEIVPESVEDRPRFRAVETRRVLQRKGFRSWQVFRYAYRPFDMRWLYWEPETKLLDEKRADYIRQVIFPSQCLATQQKSRGESTPPQYISQPACLDLLDRGASCFPSVVVESAGSLLPTVEVRSNLTPEALLFLSRMSAQENDVFYHALATMHSPAYRTENAGALLSDWPRIPLPAGADLCSHSAFLGRRLAELLGTC